MEVPEQNDDKPEQNDDKPEQNDDHKPEQKYDDNKPEQNDDDKPEQNDDIPKSEVRLSRSLTDRCSRPVETECDIVPTGALGRLSKSTSWFNSFSRKKMKKLSAQKNTPGVPRLNKSEWDIRKQTNSPDSLNSQSESLASTSLSTDCLDIDGTITDFSTFNLTELDESMADGAASSNSGPPHPNLYFTLDSRRLASMHRKSQRDMKLMYGVKQFNLDPKRGLDYLHEAGFLDQTSTESVASFLFRQERLSKKQIGAYLGSHVDFNKDVLSHFVKFHEFTKLLLVQALRQFLWSFRLPGESMQIDRVMDAFSSHYCSQNKNIFEEHDTCFILSFSIIMLNTALHNPNSKMKISAEQFIKQNKGINSGRDLPPDMLEAIFRNIKEEPFKIPDETYDDLMYTFFSPEREGWLLKEGGSWKTWKRRWFVLNDRCLYYFQHTAENVPKGIIPLENVKVRKCQEKDGKEFYFEIYSEIADIIKGCKTDSGGTVVQGNHKQYRMCASSEEDRDCWIHCIQEAIRDNPFYKIISDKKAAIRKRNGTGLRVKTS